MQPIVNLYKFAIIDTKVQIDGYVGIRRDRISGAGGGVVAFVRDDLNFQRRTDLENHMIEGVWLELFVNTQSQSSSVLHTDPQTHQSI